MSLSELNTPTVRYKDTGVSGIVSRNFTRRAFYKRVWGEVEMKSRGYFYIPALDNEGKPQAHGQIVGRGFDKFFDTDDELSPDIEYPLTVSVKENGYLGLLFQHEGELHLWTKSGPTEYSERAMAELRVHMSPDDEKNLIEFLATENVTVALEVVLPREDPHLVGYDRDELYVLAVIDNSDTFNVRWDLFDTGVLYFLPLATIWHDVERTELVQIIESLENSELEGLVVYGANGVMGKIKFDYYVRLKEMRKKIEKQIPAEERTGPYWVTTPTGSTALDMPRLYVDAGGNIYDTDLEANMIALVIGTKDDK